MRPRPLQRSTGTLPTYTKWYQKLQSGCKLVQQLPHASQNQIGPRKGVFQRVFLIKNWCQVRFVENKLNDKYPKFRFVTSDCYCLNSARFCLSSNSNVGELAKGVVEQNSVAPCLSIFCWTYG